MCLGSKAPCRIPLQGASLCVYGATHTEQHGASSRRCRGLQLPWKSNSSSLHLCSVERQSQDGEFIPPTPNARDLLPFPPSHCPPPCPVAQGKSAEVFCRFLALWEFPGCLAAFFSPKGCGVCFFPVFPLFPSCVFIPGVCLSSLGRCSHQRSLLPFPSLGNVAFGVMETSPAPYQGSSG